MPDRIDPKEKDVSDTAQTTTQARNNLASDFNALVRDAEQLLGTMARDAGGSYDEARESLQERLHTARETLEALQRSVADGGARACGAADGYVRRRPWESIGIGAGVGLLLGMLIARR